MRTGNCIIHRFWPVCKCEGFYSQLLSRKFRIAFAPEEVCRDLTGDWNKADLVLIRVVPSLNFQKPWVYWQYPHMIFLHHFLAIPQLSLNHKMYFGKIFCFEPKTPDYEMLPPTEVSVPSVFSILLLVQFRLINYLHTVINLFLFLLSCCFELVPNGLFVFIVKVRKLFWFKLSKAWKVSFLIIKHVLNASFTGQHDPWHQNFPYFFSGCKFPISKNQHSGISYHHILPAATKFPSSFLSISSDLQHPIFYFGLLINSRDISIPSQPDRFNEFNNNLYFLFALYIFLSKTFTSLPSAVEMVVPYILALIFLFKTFNLLRLAVKMHKISSP